jgi:hypothetical protein
MIFPDFSSAFLCVLRWFIFARIHSLTTIIQSGSLFLSSSLAMRSGAKRSIIFASQQNFLEIIMQSFSDWRNKEIEECRR